MANACMSCLKTIKEEHTYCPSCKKSLFDGKNVKRLDFDKAAFYEYRQEMAPRLSISGVQAKISLDFDKNNPNKLVPVENKGRYILKPIPEDRTLRHSEDIVANEHVSMQISSQVFKIRTAHNGLIRFGDGELAYITKRFDYASDGSKLPQEDFASILGKTEEKHQKNYKYQGSYEKIAKIVADNTAKPQLNELYKRVLLNYLILNGDAHLKNFSLQRQEKSKIQLLSPSYDVLMTRYHVADNDMALDLFEAHETSSHIIQGFYSLEDFELFGKTMGLNDKLIRNNIIMAVDGTKIIKDLVMRSYLSSEAKTYYINRYTNYLVNRVLTPVGSYKSTLFTDNELGAFRISCQHTIV